MVVGQIRPQSKPALKKSNLFVLKSWKVWTAGFVTTSLVTASLFAYPWESLVFLTKVLLSIPIATFILYLFYVSPKYQKPVRKTLPRKPNKPLYRLDTNESTLEKNSLSLLSLETKKVNQVETQTEINQSKETPLVKSNSIVLHETELDVNRALLIDALRQNIDYEKCRLLWQNVFPESSLNETLSRNSSTESMDENTQLQPELKQSVTVPLPCPPPPPPPPPPQLSVSTKVTQNQRKTVWHWTAVPAHLASQTLFSQKFVIPKETILKHPILCELDASITSSQQSLSSKSNSSNGICSDLQTPIEPRFAYQIDLFLRTTKLSANVIEQQLLQPLAGESRVATHMLRALQNLLNGLSVDTRQRYLSSQCSDAPLKFIQQVLSFDSVDDKLRVVLGIRQVETWWRGSQNNSNVLELNTANENEDLGDCMKRYQQVTATCHSLMNCTALSELFQILAQIGYYLNTGEWPLSGACRGFLLSSLSRLTSLKVTTKTAQGTSQTQQILPLLVKLIAEQWPQVHHGWRATLIPLLLSVNQTPRSFHVQWRQLEQERRAIQSTLQQIRDLLVARKEQSLFEQVFDGVLEVWLEEWEKKVTETWRAEQEAVEAFNALRLKFGMEGDNTTLPDLTLEQLLAPLTQFLLDYQQHCKLK